MEENMGQKLNQREELDQWIATEHIARFQLKLSQETNTCERKLLEALIVLEIAKIYKNPLEAVIAAASPT
jgi:hypothetical protein